MKLIKYLDSKATSLVSESLNQKILKALVIQEQSVSDLSKELDVPTLKIWRRMQMLLRAELVELSRTNTVGNMEQKLYRATATRYVPQQFLEFKPKDPNLQEAFEIYSEIQKKMMAMVAGYNDIPATYPADFALYASMQAFAKICSEPATQIKLAELIQKLSKYENTRPNKQVA